MRLNTDLPREYAGEILNLPPFDKKGKITKRTLFGLENALFLYSNLSRIYAEKTDNNPDNFRIKEVKIVGSGARENKIDSDLDLLLIAPEVDEVSANSLKTMLSLVLFCDRPKIEAVDVFIRSYDRYPDRVSRDITLQVKEIVDKYNSYLFSH